MTTKESVLRILSRLPERSLRELLEYAQFLALRSEAADWHEFALRELAKGYGPNEPEYTEADIKPELER